MNSRTSLFSPPPNKAPFRSIDRATLEAAADWYVQLKSETPCSEQEAALAHWIEANDNHRRAWELMQQMDKHLGSIPGALMQPALKTKKSQRRAVMKTFAVLLSAGAIGFAVRDSAQWKTWTADYRTRVGERRKVRLADGSALDLNTETSVDVSYSDNLRLVRLLHGEVLAQTANDISSNSAHGSRPFVIETPQGHIRALGTRFSVRRDDQRTYVSVFEHAVEVTLPIGQKVRVEAGEGISFSSTEMGNIQALPRSQDAWTRGMLVAIDQRLDDFLAELSRYRRGRLLCDPAISHLRVTGAYRLDDTDASLHSLMASHPLQLRYYTRFWVQVEPDDSRN